ncbi:anthranilate synthase component I [Clostridium sp. 19966]|uniref:anthranilate synthase component I n=1 Tax=Clostridium sp. 19966 TaxID=2768166 RepID=UPI0028DFCFC4|nr:anthranilate synthase component I [Clostridium sp. 19966]MDT8717094.1 anthranilate synthase component I [Clostridium sp. 19966]
MINMSKENFNKKVKEGKVFNLYLQFYGDEITPISIFYNLEGKNKFLLESAFFNENKGRFSYMGSNPYKKIFSRRDEVTTIDETENRFSFNGNVMKELKSNIKLPYDGELDAFAGGAIGYLGYDAVRLFEKIPDNNEDELNVPDSFFNLYKTIIVYDHLKHSIKILYNVFPEEEKSYESIAEELNSLKDKIKEIKSLHSIDEKHVKKEFKASVTKEHYESMVEKAKEYIKAGDIFQVVPSQRFTAETDEAPFEVYRRLRIVNPSPYLFYIEFDGFTVVGASPESLVKCSRGIVETNPIAGTRRRGETEEEDKRLKEELLTDEKERAEHLMLVDLGRNDIGRISKFGTVEVKRFMEIDFYSHVMHMVSTVSGSLKEDKDCFDALSACFPAGTVSGAPKIRAMEIIEELENVRRGIYAGSVGFFSFNGDMDNCIAIRTIVFKDNKAYIQAGGGVVYDSEGSFEYEESLNKLRALKEVI